MERHFKINTEGLLSNPDVLNTSIGVKMIDDLSKADPEKACLCMMNAYGNASYKDFQKIQENRRDLCWTLSRLCFNKSTFLDAATLMLRFAVIEEEAGFGCAKSGLQKLFFPRLGATEADLKTRLVFINNHVGKPEVQAVMLIVLDACLSLQVAFFHDGTEQLANRTMMPYEPNSDEIGDYLTSVVGILENLANSDNEKIRRKVIDIVESHFIELCKFEYAGIILPLIEKLCGFRQNRWDTVLDKLLLFRDDMHNELSPALYEVYQNLISKLTKDDFVFRFKRVEKELYSSPLRVSTEKIMIEQRRRYEALGEEFCNNNLLNKDLLATLYDTEVISTAPFGEVLARMLPDQGKNLFVDYSIEILNQREKSQYDIMVDFAYGLTDDEFEAQFNKMLALKQKRIVFAAVARRSTSFANPYTDVLIDLVQSGEATSDLFVTYWSNFRFAYMKDEDIAAWMLRIRELPNGASAVLHILQSAISGGAFAQHPKVVEVAMDTVVNMNVDIKSIMHYYQYWNVVRLLLSKEKSPELAKRINELLLEYVKTQEDLLINNYEVSQTYRMLLGSYFDEIWDDLSKALLSDGSDVWTYYKLKDIMGSMIGGVRNEIGLLFENDHTDALMEWCRKNPNIAPERLMEMAPAFDGNTGFSKIITMLIDEFGQNPAVLRALDHNLGSFGVYGSVNALYEKELKAVETLRNHQYPEVRAWSDKSILYLKNEMEKEASGLNW